MKFSFVEQEDMLFIYGEAQQNSTRAQALHIEQYPDQMHSSHRLFQRINEKNKKTNRKLEYAKI